MSINIINNDDSDKLHLYRERHRNNGELWFKCFYYNGIEIYYEEYHWGGRLSKRFYI